MTKCYFGSDGNMICPNQKQVEKSLPKTKKCVFKDDGDVKCIDVDKLPKPKKKVKRKKRNIKSKPKVKK